MVSLFSLWTPENQRPPPLVVTSAVTQGYRELSLGAFSGAGYLLCKGQAPRSKFADMIFDHPTSRGFKEMQRFRRGLPLSSEGSNPLDIVDTIAYGGEYKRLG